MIPISIDLLSLKQQLSISKVEGKLYIWDPIRCKKLILQPEEMVRQLFLQYLIINKFPVSRIAVERGFQINDVKKRFDIVVFDQFANPFILIECKSHREKINQKAIDQLLAYNLHLDSSYQVVTNGINTYCFKIDKENKKLISIKYIPKE